MIYTIGVPLAAFLFFMMISKANIKFLGILIAVLILFTDQDAFADMTAEAGETVTLSANETLTLDGGLTIAGTGTVDASASSANINLTGNWSNSGSFTQGTNTVTFNGTSQTITGNTTFYNFNKTVVSADTLTFGASSTQSIASGGLVTLKGAASNLLNLRSTLLDTQWDLVIPDTATEDIQYVDVRDGDLSLSGATHKPLNPPNSVNTANNTAWFGALLSVAKSSQTVSDPFNLGVNPLAIPGSVIQYTITISNAAGAATAENVVITDGIVGQTSELDFVAQFSSDNLRGIVVAHPDYNAGAETEYTNASDGAEFGGVSADWNVSNLNEVTVSGINLDAGESATLKYKVTVK